MEVKWQHKVSSLNADRHLFSRRSHTWINYGGGIDNQVVSDCNKALTGDIPPLAPVSNSPTNTLTFCDVKPALGK